MGEISREYFSSCYTLIKCEPNWIYLSIVFEYAIYRYFLFCCSAWPNHLNVLIPSITKLCLLRRKRKKKKGIEFIIIMILCFLWVLWKRNSQWMDSSFRRKNLLWGVEMYSVGWEIWSQRGRAGYMLTNWLGKTWSLKGLVCFSLSIQSKLESTSQTESKFWCITIKNMIWEQNIRR